MVVEVVVVVVVRSQINAAVLEGNLKFVSHFGLAVTRCRLVSR